VVDTKALLKGFGAAADVAGQIATDKAVNSRRVRSSFSQFDITNGQLIEDAVSDPDTKSVPHGLNRVPKGALVLKASTGVVVEGVTRTEVILDTASAEVTLWVV